MEAEGLSETCAKSKDAEEEQLLRGASAQSLVLHLTCPPPLWWEDRMGLWTRGLAKGSVARPRRSSQRSVARY